MHQQQALRLRWAANDVARNKGVTAALGVMLLLSAFLMVTGATVVERLTGSIDELFAQAQPPHLLQMHTGDHDRDAVARFADARPEVDRWQIVGLLGYDGSALSWQRPATGERGDLSDNLVDQLAVTQNEEFDFLVDADGHAPHPRTGEVFLPIVHHQQHGLEVGDVLTIRTDGEPLVLTVRGFVRDAQMASSMASAVRFLVSPEDFAALERSGGAAPEVIVEFRLVATAGVSEVQRAYEADEALPHNGQLVTHQMIVLVNAVSDGLVAVVLMMTSAVLMAIALLNMRFVIRGALEADVAQIGALKAIGIGYRTIRGLHLGKYRVLSLVACVIGGISGAVVAGLVLRAAHAGGSAPLGPATFLVPVAAATGVHLFVLTICRGVMRQIRRVDVVTAMVHGSLLDPHRQQQRAVGRTRRLRRSRLVGTHSRTVNRRLAWLDLRTGIRQWVLIPIVFGIAVTGMVLPANLYVTFSSPDFVTHLGSPRSDLRADIRWSEDIDRTRDELVTRLRDDPRVARVEVFASLLRQVQGVAGPELLRVDVGDQSAAPINYVRGGPPAAGQIALSVLNAEKYQVAVGDRIELADEDGLASAGWVSTEVSGIYSDVTSGGLTARMDGQVTEGATGYVIHVDLTEGVSANQVADEYDALVTGATVIPMDEYVSQTMGSVTRALGVAAVVAAVFGVGVCTLVITVWLKLHLARRRSAMGALSVTGFSISEILTQIRGSTVVAILAGVLVGLVLVATVGESVVAGALSLAGIGLAGFSFLPNPVVSLALPLALVAVPWLAAVMVTAGLRRVDKSAWLA